jgi:hypothetical protein
MGLFDKSLKNNSNNRESFPINLYNQIIQDNGKNNIVLAIESYNIFPTPPFVSHCERGQRSNKIFYSKMFHGKITLTKEHLKIDNSSALHTPKFDLGHEIELDYTLTIYMTTESWTLDYYDKKTGQTKTMIFDQFLYYGGSN